MEIRRFYWMWKTATIDFEKLLKCKVEGDKYLKIEYIFKYLPFPSREINEWRTNAYSEEYNKALTYAEEFGLIKRIRTKEEIVEIFKDNGLSETVSLFIEDGDYNKAIALIRLYEDVVNSPLSDEDQEALLLDVSDRLLMSNDFN